MKKRLSDDELNDMLIEALRDEQERAARADAWLAPFFFNEKTAGERATSGRRRRRRVTGR